VRSSASSKLNYTEVKKIKITERENRRACEMCMMTVLFKLLQHSVFITVFYRTTCSLVFISLDSVDSVVPGTHAQQPCTTILNCEVLCSIGR